MVQADLDKMQQARQLPTAYALTGVEAGACSSEY